MLRVNILYNYLALIYGAGMNEGLQDRLISVLQLHVLADEADGHFGLGIFQLVEELAPFGQLRFFFDREVQFLRVITSSFSRIISRGTS